ncbi:MULTISPECIES: selenoneine biosynthesis selenosugar synthase SenB [Marinobacter]|uniref:Glycosyl transferase, group 1 family protein n=1 Tax=Marinobacter nauticus TaxID=2743 RepID=A0A833JU48_MARNT|nr:MULTISPECIES: selenoneine biosynthesis selenosugar synthase SenB [Marinobacter]KAE8546566.1 Glycosyl transferase, group 1 family protein [Marinobacter nauticus]MAH31270.1 TIGR04348 family glycosyltransferase [Marinobacter sp.]MEC9386287.1 selenoneine biosynthesis selenosugar synthase SenB [Pseudomonadota bacterium]|tara:strand:- start:1076 stop:2041 length:966 start_codon:yes stop_codon:yes gene_type:complete
MRLTIVTPAGPDSKAGNRATALRWQNLLESAGHQVEVVTQYEGQEPDCLIALHAWRSAEAVKQYRQAWPEKPLIVVLTGTDIYRFQHEFPDITRASMDAADLLIGLHDLVAEDIPERYHDKLLCLRQSAPKPSVAGSARAERDQFHVCVIGHLRDEKDSLRAAWACYHLPEDSRVVVSCAGKAHNEAWREKALEESRSNPRFHYLGELDKPKLEHLMAVSNLMVISSVMEGGANVVSEACRAGLPILASDIPGNRGLLGDDYPGYFPVKDDEALARLMLRAETDVEFLAELRAKVTALASTFTPERELESLEQALARCKKG